MLSRLHHHLPLWRRALRRRRRLLAFLAVAVLTVALLPAVLPPSTRGADVLVADVAIPAGTVLEAEHLRTVHVSGQLLPEGAVSAADQVQGRTARVDITPGTPLLPDLLTSEDGPAVPEGTVLMALPVPDSLHAHLRPGTGIELIPADPAQPARSAIVAEVIEIVPSSDTAGGLGAPASAAEAVVAVPRERSSDVAHALVTGRVLVSVIGS